MICRPDFRPWLAAAALMGLAPAAAAPSGDPAGHELIAEADAALQRGDGIAAEVAARRALDAGASHEAVAALMGEAELFQGNLAEAREWLGPGRFSPATRQRGYQALARIEMLDRNIEAAARAFDLALSAGTPTALLWVDIARFRYANGEHRLAIAAADSAVETDPDEPRALELRGQLLRDSGGLTEALAWFEQALEKAPDDLGLLGEYAATLGESGRYRDMLETARRMVEIDPGHPRAYYLQAVLAARAGLDHLARKLLWRTDGAYDDLPAGRLLHGVLALRTGNAALAVEQFDVLARRQSDNAVATLLLGRALLASGEANEVVARLGPAAEMPAASPYVLTLVGRAYEHLGERGQAARYLDRAARAPWSRAETLPVDEAGEFAIWRASEEPGVAAAVALLRRMLSQGRHEDAADYAATLHGRYPGSADIELLAGDVALLSRDLSGALGRYRGVAEVRRNWAVTERIVFVLQSMGDRPRADAMLADHLRQAPRARAAAAMLARSATDQNQWRDAVTLYRHAVAVGGAHDPFLLADLAEAEFRAGQAEAAQSTARHAYALQRSNGAATATLARILRAANEGSAEEAAMRAKAARMSNPQRPR